MPVDAETIQLAREKAIKAQEEEKNREREAIRQAIEEWSDENPGKSYRANKEAGDWIASRSKEIIEEIIHAKKVYEDLDEGDAEERLFSGGTPVSHGNWMDTLNHLTSCLRAEGYNVLHIQGPGTGGEFQFIVRAEE